MYKLTVIVPVGPLGANFFKMKEWVVDCISLGIQVVLVLDSLPDELKKQFDNVFKVERETNAVEITYSDRKSPGISRNIGIKLSQGEWITFWDCDDFPNPHNVIHEVLNAPESIEVIVGQYKVNGDEKSTKNLLDIAVNPGHWRIVYRKNYIGTAEFANTSWGEDQLFLIENGFYLARIQISNLSFYDYRIGLSSQITNQKIHLRSLETAIERAIDASKAVSEIQLARIGICIMILRMSLTYSLRSNGHHKIRAVKFFFEKNLQLFKIYGFELFLAYLNLFVRVALSR